MKFARFTLPVIVIFVLGVFAASAGAASKPNLKVKGVTATPASVAVGGSISVSATVVNAGRGKAKKSSVSFVLRARRNQESDTQDVAKKTVKSLKKGGKKTLTITVTNPAGLAPGSYFVGACADGARKVAETKESDNCAFTKTPITVTAIPTTTGPGTPGGEPAVKPANTVAPSITGSPGVGRAVTAVPGTWTPATGVFFLRQWLVCSDNSTISSCTVISGAEGATYTPVAGDENNYLRLRVTGTNAAGSSSATSDASAIVVPDADLDGVPDDADCRPADARLPGAGHPDVLSCIGRTYDLFYFGGVDGAVVALSNVLVSAIKSPDDGTAYVQVKNGDAGYDAILGPKFSGIEVSNAFGQQVGDRVNLYGVLNATPTGWVLDTETIEPISSVNESVPPAFITFTEFETNGAPYDGAYLDLSGITIASIDSAGWHLSGTSIVVDKTLIGTLPAAVVGQSISTLRGIGDSFDSNRKLMPRNGSDIVLDPVSCGLTVDSLTPPTTDC